jgi:transcriptional regulator GlxA family with amidase domain
MEKKVIFNPLADTSNIKLLDELCVWIASNLDSDIGWEQLIAQSKLNHKDLQNLFEKYKQTTPMTYVRKLRQASNKKPIVLDKMRINPIFITKENE